MASLLLKVSRPRFWMYLIGPYLIGIGGAQAFNGAVAFNPHIWWWLLYFSFPANLFIYGINDIADSDTDAFNSKKGTYEAKVEASQKKTIIVSMIIATLCFIPLVLLSSFIEQLCFVIFIIFGAIYSLPPFRLKARPFIDSLSNGVLYTMAGIMGFVAAGGSHIAWIPYVAAALWASVMHAYSAIPDIEADTKAHIKTIATVLGAYRTLLVCFGIYVLIGILLIVSGLPIHSMLILPYLVLIGVSVYLQKKHKNVFKIYKLYPYVTYIVGALVYACNVNF